MRARSQLAEMLLSNVPPQDNSPLVYCKDGPRKGMVIYLSNGRVILKAPRTHVVMRGSYHIVPHRTFVTAYGKLPVAKYQLDSVDKE